MQPESLLDTREPYSTSVSSILVVDDSIEDSLAITRLLRHGRNASLRVITAPNMLDALREFRHERPDCVLIDHRLADGDGIELLHMLSEVTAPLPAPVIYLASEDSPRLAVRALKAGALDYLAKSWLDAESLRNAVERAVEKVALAKARYDRQRATEDKNRDLQKSVQTLQQSEKAKEQITGLAPTFLYVYDLLEDQLVYTNQTMLNTLGYSAVEMQDMRRGGIQRMVHPEDLAGYEVKVHSLSNLADGDIVESELRLQHRSGDWIWLHFRETVFLRDKLNRVWQIIGSAEDVSTQRASRRSLEARTNGLELELKDLKAVWDQNLIGIAVTIKHRSNRLKLNSVLAELLGLDEETDLRSFARVFGFTSASSPFGKALSRGIPTRNVERVIHKPDGSSVYMLETIHPLLDLDGAVTGCIAYFLPIAEGDSTHGTQAERDDVWHSKLTQLQSKLEVAESQRSRAEEQLKLSERVSSERQRLLEETEQKASSLRAEIDSRQGSANDADTLLANATERAREAEIKLAESERRWQESLTNLLEIEESKNSLSTQLLQLQSDALENKEQLELRTSECKSLKKQAEEAQAGVKKSSEQLLDVEIALEIANTRALEAEQKAKSHASIFDLLSYRVEQLTAQVGEGQAAMDLAKQLEIRLQEAQTSLVLLENERNNATASLKELEARLAKFISDQENSKTDLATHEDQTQALRFQVDHLTSKLTQTEEERNRLLLSEKESSRDLALARSDLAKSLKEVSEQGLELEKVRNELQEGWANQASLEESLLKLGEALASRSVVSLAQEGKIAELESLTAELESDRSTLQQEHDRMRGEFELLKIDGEADQLRTQEAERKVFSLEIEIGQLAQELEKAGQELETERGTIAELTRRTEILQASENEATRLVKSLQQNNLEIADRLAKIEALAVSRGDSLVELGKVVDRNAELLAEARGKRDESEKHVLALEEQIRSGQAKLHLAEESWRKAETELDLRSREASRLGDEVRAQAKTIESLTKECDAAQKASLEAETRLTEWQRTAPEGTRRLQEAIDELAAVKQKLASADETNDILEQSLLHSSDERDEILHQFEEMSSELKSISAEGERLNQELANVSEKERQARENLARTEQALAKRQNELKETTAQLQASRDEAQSLDSQLRMRTFELESRVAEIARIQSLMAKSEEDRKAAQDRLIESENKLRQTQQNLRNSEEKYRSLAASVPGIIFTTNSLGMIEFVNDRWEHYVGEGMEESRAKNWKDAVFADDLDAFASTWIAGIKEGNAFSIQFRLKRNDNVYRWHELHHAPDIENGRIPRWYGTINEIHEQVISREAARQARLRYGALLDSTSEAVLFLSPSGNVLGASKSSLNLLRQGSEGVVGQLLWETKWWPKLERDKLQDAVRRAAAGERVDLETMRVDIDGQPRPVALIINPVKDEDQQVAMLVPYFRDL